MCLLDFPYNLAVPKKRDRIRSNQPNLVYHISPPNFLPAGSVALLLEAGCRYVYQECIAKYPYHGKQWFAERAPFPSGCGALVDMI